MVPVTSLADGGVSLLMPPPPPPPQKLPPGCPAWAARLRDCEVRLVFNSNHWRSFCTLASTFARHLRDRLYLGESESNIASGWVHGKSKFMFILSSDRDQSKWFTFAHCKRTFTCYSTIITGFAFDKFQPRLLIVSFFYSRNFVQDNMCMEYFRLAHHNMVAESKTYLIVVLLETLDVDALSNRDLQMYIRTRTYIDARQAIRSPKDRTR